METQLLILTVGHGISAFLLLSVGVFVLVKGSRRIENTLFFLLAFFTAAFNISAGIGINLHPSEFAYGVWFFNILDVFITTSYVHFIIHAIDRQGALKWFIRLTYLIAFIIFGVAMLFPQLFIPEVTSKLYLNSYLNPGPLYHAMLIFFIVFPLIAFYELVRAYFRGGFDRLKAEYYIAMSFVGYGIGLWSFALVYDLKVDPLLGAFVGFYMLPIAYGIVAKQLLDIRFVVKRAFFYAVGIALVAAGLVVIMFLNNLLVSEFPVLRFWTVPLGAAMVSVFLGRAYWVQAQENDRLKYEFISIATHKLRTPLTRIKWEISSITESFKDNKAVVAAALRIDDANNKLIALTNVLVEAAETDDIYYGYKKKYFDLRDVILKAIERSQSLANKRAIRIIPHIAPKLSLINGDADRIASAVDVLLENACMYSHEGGEVRVSLEEKAREITFKVSDDGIGISSEDRKRVFTRFFRSHTAKMADTEGMGLGLSMAKSIIDKHHGEIGVDSPGPGKGSTFWFTIPI